MAGRALLAFLKACSACQCRRGKTWGSIPGWGRSPGEGDGNLLILLACEIPPTEESSSLQSVGLQRVGHGWMTKHTHTKHLPGNNSENHEKVHLKRCNMSWLMKLRIPTMTTETNMRRKKKITERTKTAQDFFLDFLGPLSDSMLRLQGPPHSLPLHSEIECFDDDI